MSDPVLIVGAGPTGLTAALELARLGVQVRLIDRMPEPATTSRALVVQARTLELMQQRGLADEMVRSGNPGRGGSLYGGGERLFGLSFDHVSSRFNYVLFLSQAETERILRDAVGRLGVAVERGVELVAVAQNAVAQDAPVRAVLRHPSGALEQTTASWLISAEGAHSVVRTTLGLPYEGKTLDQDFVLADLHFDGDLADNEMHLFASEHGFLGLFPLGRGRFRAIASHPDRAAAPGSAPTLDEVQRLYDQRSPIPARGRDMVWSSWFRINSRMVPRLKVGRLLLGGDAAHIHSPAGGQGMNTGIQDMINLGWKLAWVIGGKARPALLDSYEQDRLPVMRDVLFKTETLTDLIGIENRLFRAAFNHLAPFIGGSKLAQANAAQRLSQIAIHYRHGPLSASHAHVGSLQGGDRVPDLAVRLDGAPARLLDALDPSRFSILIAGGEADAPLDPDLAAAAQFGDLARTLALAPPADPAAAKRYRAALGLRASVFLVRPDGYVALAAGRHRALHHLRAFRARWLTH